MSLGGSCPCCGVWFPFWRQRLRGASGLSGSATFESIAGNLLGPDGPYAIAITTTDHGAGMYLDVPLQPSGMHDASDRALRVELNRYSLRYRGYWAGVVLRQCFLGFWKNDPFSPGRKL